MGIGTQVVRIVCILLVVPVILCVLYVTTSSSKHKVSASPAPVAQSVATMTPEEAIADVKSKCFHRAKAGWDANSTVIVADGKGGASRTMGAIVKSLTMPGRQWSAEKKTTEDGIKYTQVRMEGSLAFECKSDKSGLGGILRPGSRVIFNFVRNDVVRNKSLDGWNIGVGGEYAFTPNWIARIEYIYDGFSKIDYGYNYNFTDRGSQIFNDNRNVGLNINTIRVGLEYKF